MSRPSDYVDAQSALNEEPQRVESPEIGVRGWLRWFWRQLTSMRVALMLLLLLAIAAIPGSLVPQRSADPNGVTQFQSEHPTLFPILDAFPIQAFDVYGSVWFSAIYLLLFISLIGCVLPRIVHHWRAWRGQPPKTPSRLQRMPGFRELAVANPEASVAEREQFAQQAIDAAAVILRKQRYRVRTQRDRGVEGDTISVSAERGYLRETGNLLFHIALVGVLISVGVGSAFSFQGQRVLVEGQTMLNQLIDYDTVKTGRSLNTDLLQPFELKLDSLDITYVTLKDRNVKALGLATDYLASMTLTSPNGKKTQMPLKVNHPLRVYGASVYLIANGYAPKVTIRNASGEVVFSEATPFIPQDNNTMMSLGVLKVPNGLTTSDGEATQLGLRGFFYPTQAKLDTGAYTSNYPDLENPVLTLDAFAGDLGLDSGVPQSVYALDTTNMTQLTGRAINKKSIELRPGETAQLPEEMGTITLEAIPRYASLDVMRNPAQQWVLVFAMLSLAGLIWSLFVPRRRMWVKAVPSDTGVTLQYAALARGDDPTLEQAVADLHDRHREQL